MIEERKQKEIEHYDKKATVDSEEFKPFLLSSYKFLQEYLKDKCKGKKILDYGCGNGVHYPWLVKFGGEAHLW